MSYYLTIHKVRYCQVSRTMSVITDNYINVLSNIAKFTREFDFYPEYPAYPCFKFFNDIQYLLSPGIKTGLIYMMALNGYCKYFYFNRDIQDRHDNMILGLFAIPCKIPKLISKLSSAISLIWTFPCIPCLDFWSIPQPLTIS